MSEALPKGRGSELPEYSNTAIGRAVAREQGLAELAAHVEQAQRDRDPAISGEIDTVAPVSRAQKIHEAGVLGQHAKAVRAREQLEVVYRRQARGSEPEPTTGIANSEVSDTAEGAPAKADA